MKKLAIIAASLVLFASCKKSDNTTPAPTTPITTPTVTPTGGTYSDLFNFTSSTGNGPYGDLIISGSTLYGMTQNGGANNVGCIFSIGTNGSGYKDLHDFSVSPADGELPYGDLTLSGTILYGMAYQGGANGGGVIFSINMDGSGYTIIHNFGTNSSDGYYPLGNLTIVGSTMYGATSEGGVNGLGNIFSISTTGTGYTNLHSFKTATGISPESSLVVSGTMIYGTAYLGGGSNNDGVAYSFNMTGSVYTILCTFTGANGANPDGSLLLSGTTLYGMTNAGGANGDGNIFSVSTTGTGFTDLLDFNGTNGNAAYGALIINGTTLYGMTTSGGTQAGGNVFSINTNGSGFSNLVSFGLGGSPGAFPHGSLLLSNGVLYGMTNSGGANGEGVIFNYSL
jgi:uncharacterized repeat protein (TIGR03803 family)